MATSAIDFLTSQTVSGSSTATLDFPTTFSANSGYNSFKIFITNCTPVTDNGLLNFRVSTDGVTFDSSAIYVYSQISNRSSNATVAGAATTGLTAWGLAGAFSNTSRDVVCCEITAFNPASTSFNKMFSMLAANYTNDAADSNLIQASLGYNSASAVKGFQISVAVGNLGSGTKVSVLGLLS